MAFIDHRIDILSYCIAVLIQAKSDIHIVLQCYIDHACLNKTCEKQTPNST